MCVCRVHVSCMVVTRLTRVHVSARPCVILSFVLYTVWIQQWQCPKRVRERREKTRTHHRPCRCPRPVGIRKRVPRTAATLQLVSETGWQHPAWHQIVDQMKINLQQLHKVAWPLVLLDVSPPRTGRALTHSSVAWPRLVVKERKGRGMAHPTDPSPSQSPTWLGLW